MGQAVEKTKMVKKKGKIGILTLPININYGGILQAYAMQRYLRQLGYDAYHITFHYWYIVSVIRDIYLIAKRILAKYFLKDKSINNIFDSQKRINAIRSREANTEYFIKKYVKYISLPKLFHKVWYKSAGIKTFIVGSDQVWRPEYGLGDFERYFFDFVEDNKVVKLSYAASFGINKLSISDSQRRNISKSLKKFKAISVREEDGIVICQDDFGVDAISSIDPTMLLKPDDYLELCKNERTQKQKSSLLVYILDRTENKQNCIDTLSSLLNLKPNIVNHTTENNLGVGVYPPVTDWIQGFFDSEFVVTDSFHGCVFSILFNKPFIAIANKERGISRFETLLKTFELTERLIDDINKLPEDILKSKINWNKVNSILQKERTNSLKYFEENLI